MRLVSSFGGHYYPLEILSPRCMMYFLKVCACQNIVIANGLAFIVQSSMNVWRAMEDVNKFVQTHQEALIAAV